MHFILATFAIALVLAARWVRPHHRGVALTVELAAYALLAFMPWTGHHVRAWLLPYSLWSAALSCLSIVAVVSYFRAVNSQFQKALYQSAASVP